MCVHALEAINNLDMILILYDWLVAFQFQFMALTINAIDEHGPSKEMRHQL